MPKMICICILLIYFKVISKKGGQYCPRLPYRLISRFGGITWRMMCLTDCSKSQYFASIIVMHNFDTVLMCND